MLFVENLLFRRLYRSVLFWHVFAGVDLVNWPWNQLHKWRKIPYFPLFSYRIGNLPINSWNSGCSRRAGTEDGGRAVGEEEYIQGSRTSLAGRTSDSTREVEEEDRVGRLSIVEAVVVVLGRSWSGRWGCYRVLGLGDRLAVAVWGGFGTGCRVGAGRSRLLAGRGAAAVRYRFSNTGASWWVVTIKIIIIQLACSSHQPLF